MNLTRLEAPTHLLAFGGEEDLVSLLHKHLISMITCATTTFSPRIDNRHRERDEQELHRCALYNREHGAPGHRDLHPNPDMPEGSLASKE